MYQPMSVRALSLLARTDFNKRPGTPPTWAFPFPAGHDPAFPRFLLIWVGFPLYSAERCYPSTNNDLVSNPERCRSGLTGTPGKLTKSLDRKSTRLNSSHQIIS